MAVLALILASSLGPAPAAPKTQVFTLDRAPWIATACDPQLDAKFVHIPKPAPSLQTVHVTKGVESPCILRGPDYAQRRSATPVHRDDPVRPIQQDPQAPPP